MLGVFAPKIFLTGPVKKKKQLQNTKSRIAKFTSDATVLTEETTCAGDLPLVSDLDDAEGQIGVVMGPGGPGGAAGVELPISMCGYASCWAMCK